MCVCEIENIDERESLCVCVRDYIVYYVCAKERNYASTWLFYYRSVLCVSVLFRSPSKQGAISTAVQWGQTLLGSSQSCRGVSTTSRLPWPLLVPSQPPLMAALTHSEYDTHTELAQHSVCYKHTQTHTNTHTHTTFSLHINSAVV